MANTKEMRTKGESINKIAETGAMIKKMIKK